MNKIKTSFEIRDEYLSKTASILGLNPPDTSKLADLLMARYIHNIAKRLVILEAKEVSLANVPIDIK